MTVSIKKGKKVIKGVAEPDPRAPHELPNGKTVSPEQMEVFGRLRLTPKQIAAYFGVSESTINFFLRRPALIAAYERGGAEVLVAIRQKQIQLALAGDSRLLIHAGEHFADMAPLREPERAPEGRSKFSWDATITKRAEALRDKKRAANGTAV